jgi:hypothetical protein
MRGIITTPVLVVLVLSSAGCGLTLIDDECGPRSADIASGMTRYAP